MNTLDACRGLDAADPLRHCRDLFDLPAGVTYLDGNSLGALPRTAAARVAEVVTNEWGTGLIRSWNSAGWFEHPGRLGDKLAPLIGAAPGEVFVTDSTSINVFKVLSAAMNLQEVDDPERRVILSERTNFPTDLYIAEAATRRRGYVLELADTDNGPEQILDSLSRDVAVLMLTHVNYRNGAMFDMAAVTKAAHDLGIVVVWDLAHSAGAVPVDLNGSGADYAVGCSYKYLNGGPGGPAFVWAASRLADRFWQPLAGWWGHEAPFEFTPDYRPAPGAARYLCGTQPIISMAAMECGLDTVLAGAPDGDMSALRTKSLALTDLFIELVEERCAGLGFTVVTPREHHRRGSQVSLGHEHAYAIMQALIARGIIGDFRAGNPDLLRFGFTPLYIGFEDVWNAVDAMLDVMTTDEWQRPEFNTRNAVT